MEPNILAAMLEGCWTFAKLMLAKAGDFYPFGETADVTGQRTMQGAYNDEEHPRPQELYRLLHDALLKDVAAGKIAAVALTANVDIPASYQPQFGDGIRVHLEAKGYSRFVYLPYRIGARSVVDRLLRRPRNVTYGESFSVDVPAEFFEQDERSGT